MSSGEVFIFLLLVACYLSVPRVDGRKQKKPTKIKPGPLDIFNIEIQMGDKMTFSGLDKLKKFFSPVQANTYNYPTRSGQSSETHMCHKVIYPVPPHLTFITRWRHYQKYTHAYGIPIVSTWNVPDAALKRACYVVRFMMGDRQILRRTLYKYQGRVGIIAQREGTTSIPEHRHLPAWWNKRARGLGGTLGIPISTGCEENLLCYSSDPYKAQDIFLHEFSHGIQEIAVRGGGIPGFFTRLTRQYNYAKRIGLWRRTYSMSTVQEYFAEGTQSFFNVNSYRAVPDGVRGPINTRAKLRTYDPVLFRMIKEVFPCMNLIHKRCDKGRKPPKFKMNCDRKTKPQPQPQPKPEVTKTPGKTDIPVPTPPEPVTEAKVYACGDKNNHCRSWARSGHCNTGTYVGFMMDNCRTSCGCCRNSNTSCDSWAQRGYCERSKGNYAYMLRYCKKACKICQKRKARLSGK